MIDGIGGQLGGLALAQIGLLDLLAVDDSLPSVQQETVSPPTATTRLTRGMSPQLSCPEDDDVTAPTSPPSIRWASTRSPATMVGDIESVGTVYGW